MNNSLDREDFRFWLSVLVSVISGIAAIGSINAHLKAGNLSRPQIAYLNNWMRILGIIGLLALAFVAFYGLKNYSQKLVDASKVKGQTTNNQNVIL